MASSSPFTYTHRVILGRIKKALNRESSRSITLDYGVTEDRLIFHATLSVQKSSDHPKEPLAAVLTGPAVGGDGYAVLSADGSTLANGVTFHHAAKVVRSVAWRGSYMSLDGLTFQSTPLGDVELHRKSAPQNNKV